MSSKRDIREEERRREEKRREGKRRGAKRREKERRGEERRSQMILEGKIAAVENGQKEIVLRY